MGKLGDWGRKWGVSTGGKILRRGVGTLCAWRGLRGRGRKWFPRGATPLGRGRKWIFKWREPCGRGRKWTFKWREACGRGRKWTFKRCEACGRGRKWTFKRREALGRGRKWIFLLSRGLFKGKERAFCFFKNKFSFSCVRFQIEIIPLARIQKLLRNGFKICKTRRIGAW